MSSGVNVALTCAYEHDKLVESNTEYRSIIYADDNVQIAVMHLNPTENIPTETHRGTQLFTVHKGTAYFLIDDVKYKVSAGKTIIVPSKTPHYVANRSKEPLKLLTYHIPPAHPLITIQERQNKKYSVKGLTNRDGSFSLIDESGNVRGCETLNICELIDIMYYYNIPNGPFWRDSYLDNAIVSVARLVCRPIDEIKTWSQEKIEYYHHWVTRDTIKPDLCRLIYEEFEKLDLIIHLQ